MSISAMNWAWGLDVPTGEKIVLLALADRANDDGECWPGYASMAEKCSMSERNVMRIVVALEEKNLLKIDHRKNPENNRQKTNVYHLNIEQKPGDTMSPGNVQKPGDICDKKPGDTMSPNTSVNQPPVVEVTSVTSTPREDKPKTAPPKVRPEGMLACRLIKLNVAVTSMNPILIEWVRQKIPDELIDQCLALARQNKPWPEKIAAGYLDAVIRSELKPKRDISWLMTDEATLAKGVELGVEARIGESMQAYRERLKLSGAAS